MKNLLSYLLGVNVLVGWDIFCIWIFKSVWNTILPGATIGWAYSAGLVSALSLVAILCIFPFTGEQEWTKQP